MALAKYTNNGFVYAIFICDGCGEPINSLEEAIITLSGLGGHPANYVTGMYHKVKCDPGNKIQPYSDEFARFMRQLIAYYGLNKPRGLYDNQ